ncbi:X-Pro dipeptidyl-peptidase protein [Phytophthora palmivora]|uniref:X-Pro dipeptidyl-peptidase protein n=1 Tax=Phytophthora palmivora TaxID=4796 RepID=A0A2P4WZF4_9STRA|nr:X-Pro dipeptidyl-peptidase protein [Phytophthora palmivora]
MALMASSITGVTYSTTPFICSPSERRGSVLVWGAFSAAGKSKLVILRGRQNPEDYIYSFRGHVETQRTIYTLSECMLTFAHANYIIQINTMIWPARSPDCNPVENLWLAMAARVYAHGRQYRTVDHLEVATLNAWAASVSSS